MARLVRPACKAFRSPTKIIKIPVIRPLPSKTATSTSNPASKRSMLPRPVLHQAVSSRSKTQIARKATGHSVASLATSRSRIPRLPTATLTAEHLRRRNQAPKRLQTVTVRPAKAAAPKALSLYRPLRSSQKHVSYKPTRALRKSRLPFLVWPLVEPTVDLPAILAGKSVAKAAPTPGASKVKLTMASILRRLDRNSRLDSVKFQTVSGPKTPVKAALKSAMRQRQSRSSVKSVQFTDGPFNTKLYSVSDSVDQLSKVLVSSDETPEWGPLFNAICDYPSTAVGTGSHNLLEYCDDGPSSITRRFLIRYAAVRRAEELRRQDELLAGTSTGLGQLEYGNEDYKIRLDTANGVISGGDIGIVLDPEEVGQDLPINSGKMLYYGGFKEFFEDTNIPQKVINPFKEPISLPLAGDSTEPERDFFATTLQAADFEA